MKRIQEIESMQDLEREIRKSRFRLQSIQFFIDQEITYAQEMFKQSRAIIPHSLLQGDRKDFVHKNREDSIWKHFMNETGKKIKSILIETVFSVLIQQLHFKSQKINK